MCHLPVVYFLSLQFFKARCSVHHNSMWIKNPTDATVCRYLFTAKLQVILQWINICILLHLLDFLFTCHYSVTLPHKHNTPDPMYRFYSQHCNVFLLSTSAIVSLASVDTKNEKLEVSPNKQQCKLVIATTVIRYEGVITWKHVIATSRYNPTYRIKHKTGI